MTASIKFDLSRSGEFIGDWKFTDEVDDEAAVGVAAGGAAAEESRAVGRARDGVEDGIGGEDDGVVAGVGVGVAEAEDGVVRPDPDGQRAGGCCPSQSQVRDEQQEKRDGAAEVSHLRVAVERNLGMDKIAHGYCQTKIAPN